jgi:hypothetical protein
MTTIFKSAAFVACFLACSALAQDWYHDRDERYHGDAWRSQLFVHVRTDLEHVWEGRASDKERRRLDRTRQELTQLQADLDQGRWDNGILNDVIDSIRKSSNDDRLPPRDRDVLRDDLARLHDYQVNHNHWKR